MSTPAKILIVDDEANIRFFLREVLSQNGYQVVQVESGEAALERIAVEEFDLALIDLKLRGIGGTQVLAALRQQSPETATIVLTGHGSLETAIEALRHGAHDYLFKPFKTVELLESVRTGLLKRQRDLQQRKMLLQLEQNLADSLEGVRAAVTERPVQPRTTSAQLAEEDGRFLQQGELIVDLARHVITMNGHLLELSPSEFNLLAYLIRSSPRVVSPQELVREVQGYESETWEARDIVRTHIYHIRRKMKTAAGNADILRTVRGVGYVINGQRKPKLGSS